MAETGLLSAVRWVWDGTEVQADLTVGTTVIPVEDPEVFEVNDDVWIGEAGPYTIASLEETTITLTTGLVTAVEQGEAVASDVGGEPGKQWVAEVVLVDSDEPIEVPLTSGDLLYMQEGTYSPARPITVSDDLQSVIDMPGQTPKVPGALVDPIDAPGGTDGSPPATSPIPIVRGVPGALLVSWPPVANADAVTYEVHIKTDIAAPTPGDVSTLIAVTSSTQAFIRSLPPIGSTTPLTYGVDYNIWVIAFDRDPGYAPLALYGTGQMQQVTGPDVSAEYVYAGTISAGQINGGSIEATLALVGKLVTAKAGRSVEISNDGITVYEQNGDVLVSFPTDPEGDFSINADVTAKRLNVLFGGDLGGKTKIKTSGVVELGAQVGGSAVPPQVTVSYDPGRVTQSNLPKAGGTWGCYVASTGWLGNFGWRISNVAEPSIFGFTEGGDRVEQTEDSIGASGLVRGYFMLPTGGKGVGVVQTSSGTLYVLQRKVTGSATNNTYWVRKYDISGWLPVSSGASPAPTLLGSYTYTAPAYSGGYLPAYQWPAIGKDETVTDGYVLASWDESQRTISGGNWVHRYRVRRFNSGGAQQVTDGNVLMDALPAMDDTELRPLAVHYGKGDLGGTTDYVWIGSSDGKCYVHTIDGARATQHDFPLDTQSLEGMSLFPTGSAKVASMGGARSGYFGGLTPLVETYYSALKWTTESSKWWAGFTWYDDTGTAPRTALAGYQHESTVSALAGFTMIKRAYATLTAPALPLDDPATVGDDEPRRIRWYLGRSSGTPARTAMWLQSPEPTAYDPASSTPAQLSWILGQNDSALDFSGTSNPPLTTTFPAAIAAILRPETTRASDGTYNWRLEGNGLVRVGEVTWDAAGKMSSNPAGRLMSVVSASTASIPDATYTVVAGWSTTIATPDFCTLPGAGGSPAGTVTINSDGLYLINASVAFVASTARRVLAIEVNGTQVRRVDVGNSPSIHFPEVVHVMRLAANDQVNVTVYQNSTAPQALSNTAPNHSFQILRLL